MQTLEQQIAQQTRELPESAQREVLHYIEFIRSRYAVNPTTKTAGKRKTSWSDTPLYGLWQDREEMADPAAYVRHLRGGHTETPNKEEDPLPGFGMRADRQDINSIPCCTRPRALR